MHKYKCEIHKSNEGFYDGDKWVCWVCLDYDRFLNPRGRVIDSIKKGDFLLRLVDGSKFGELIRVVIFNKNKKIVGNERFRDLSVAERRFYDINIKELTLLSQTTIRNPIVIRADREEESVPSLPIPNILLNKLTILNAYSSTIRGFFNERPRVTRENLRSLTDFLRDVLDSGQPIETGELRDTSRIFTMIYNTNIFNTDVISSIIFNCSIINSVATECILLGNSTEEARISNCFKLVITPSISSSSRRIAVEERANSNYNIFMRLPPDQFETMMRV